jgi:hypothetical protein
MPLVLCLSPAVVVSTAIRVRKRRPRLARIPVQIGINRALPPLSRHVIVATSIGGD